MANSVKLSSEMERVGTLIRVTETTVTELSESDLRQNVFQFELQQSRIREQMENMKSEYDKLEALKQDTLTVLSQYETTDLPVV